MSESVRSKLGISREQELELPIQEWVNALPVPQRTILQQRDEHDQRAWRTNPFIQSIIEGMIGNLGAPSQNAGPSAGAPASKASVKNTKEEAKKKKSSSEAVEPMGSIFGGDDGW
jgi:hypothetical protein